MARTYRDSGIILQKYELGEADSLITIFLQDSGLTRTVAKGVRRMTSRKRGHVELFNNVDVLLAHGQNLDVMVEASVLDTFESWRQDLTRVSLAYYAADITLMLLPDQEPYPKIHQHFIQLLAWLGHAHHPEAVIRWYEVQLLQNLGYWASNQLSSQSQNAIQLLESFVGLSCQNISTLRLAPRLQQEMEQLMGQQLMLVIERQTKSQHFVDQVREMDSGG